EAIIILLFAAGAAKIAFGFIGARAGRLPFWEAATVGVGLNLKGGTDVVVAIVGTELLLLSSDLYTTYAVVAILTVIACPPLMNWLAAKSLPGEQELRRLNREEARKLAYLADRERILLPLAPELLPSFPARLISAIATAKHAENELFDVTELTFEEDLSITRADTPDDLVQASSLLSHAADFEHVGLERVSSKGDDLFASIQTAAEGQHLLSIGAASVRADVVLSFGEPQDRILREIPTDVMLTVSADTDTSPIRRILVPVNGLGHSLAAADVAAYIGKGSDAEVVLLTVVAPRLGPLFWRERKHRDLLQAGYTITREAKARISRLDVRHSDQVVLASTPAEAIMAELQRQPYDLMVLGGVLRSSEKGISLGRTIEYLLHTATIPRVLLLSRAVETGV
ncbi:MAG TPA: universal stress protein, partial [Acidobacteriaceae bacterium]|nr:universal stress protein [Acidobacteriaceae bacterium]